MLSQEKYTANRKNMNVSCVCIYVSLYAQEYMQVCVSSTTNKQKNQETQTVNEKN